MGRERGFTLVELLIVVAIIAILAAVAIPALMRSKISANESAAVGDIRTVLSAQAAYHSVNGGYYEGSLACLTNPQGCLPSYPASGPTFLDSNLAALNPKAGYNRMFAAGSPPAPQGTISPTSMTTYKYDAIPSVQSQSGIRGFAGDQTGRLCFTANGAIVPAAPGGGMIRTCDSLQ